MPRHEFESLANKHHTREKFSSFSRWAQFIARLTAQLTGRDSLRDIVDNFSAQVGKFYHLGIKSFSRATLSRANEQSHRMHGDLFHRLLGRCQNLVPRNKKFKFKGSAKLYLLDATMIDLILSLFPWAKYRKSKGAC